MPDDTSRRGFLAAIGTGTAAAIAGCSGGEGQQTTEATTTEMEQTTETESTDTETETTTQSQEGGTLRTALAGSIKSLDPVIKGTGGVDQWAETLVQFKEGTLPATMELAEDFTISNEGKTYSFKLKEGVTFHDGTELTASDFVYSWERLAQSPNTENNDDIIGGTFTVQHEKEGGEDLSDYVPGSLAVRAPDKYTFEFDLVEAFHAALTQVAAESSFVAIPENTVGDIEREDVKTEGKYSYQEAFGTQNGGPKVAGTGPFQVETWSKGDELVMTRYDDYYGEVANIDRINEVILGGGTAAYQRALNGNLDIFQVPLSKFNPDNRAGLESIGGGRRVGTYTLENGTEVNYGEVNALETDYILFNCDRVDKPVRQAIALVLNQADIAQNIYKGEQPAYALTPPQVYPDSPGDFESPAAAYRAHFQDGAMAQTKWGQDGYPWGVGESRIQEARQLVQDAGLEGNEYTFTYRNDVALWEPIASRIQQKMEAVGITINLQTTDYGTIISEGGLNHKMDFFSLGDSMEWPESDNFLRFLPPNAANGKFGFTQWGRKTDAGEWETEQMRTAQDAWDNLYNPNRGPGEQQQLQRDKAYLTIEEINWDVMQELPLTFRVNREYWSTDLENYRPPGVMGDIKYNRLSINRS